MNDVILVGFVSLVALAGTIVYWRRRERTVRESLTVSREWETTPTTVAREERQAAEEAATRLDARVTDLPERVAAVDEERRDLRRELDGVRERWADAWWLSRPDTGDEALAVVSVAFDGWELPDARAFAKRAMEEEAITLVVARGDDSFAVAVGDPLTDSFGADEIADEITNIAGGGAGGNDRLATGGGATGDIGAACRRVTTELRGSVRTVAGVEEE